jgi:hypothetical protein
MFEKTLSEKLCKVYRIFYTDTQSFLNFLRIILNRLGGVGVFDQAVKLE